MKAWRRWMAVTCSHAQHLCPDARRAVLAFARSFRPHTLAHLGDFLDTTAFRSGARGTTDEGADVDMDMDAGALFVREFFDSTRASRRILFRGNHEDRVFRLAHHPSGLIRKAAGDVVRAIENLAIIHRCEGGGTVPYHIEHGWRRLGADTILGHGYMYNTQAARDHAEMAGCNVVFGHIHRVEITQARTIAHAKGYSIGWLGACDMDYAKARRQTLSWTNAFAWGEYQADGATTINVCERPRGGEWRLPS